jgi:multimeric flavodoxin WrbA
MLILGIVGSPRKGGRTNTLIDAALEGAAQGGAETQKLYLVDYAIKPFTGGGGAQEANAFCPPELSAQC